MECRRQTGVYPEERENLREEIHGAGWQQIGNRQRKRGQAGLPNPLNCLVELIGIEPTIS